MTDPRRSSAVPAGDHLDLDALADVLAGERADDGHLRACAACTDRLGELQAAEVAVVASLATLPDPVVPDGLVERLTAALRAEPSLQGSAAHDDADGPAPVTSATVTTLPARRRTWLPSVAAAAALVLAGGLAWTALQGAGGPADTASSTAAGGGAEDAAEAGADARVAPGAVRNDSGIDYADEAQRRATLPQVLAGTAGGGASGDDAEVGPAPESATSLSTAGAAAADPLDRLRDPAALEGCLSALRPPDQPEQQPLALDYARFQGDPALAVVLPDPDPDKLSLFVVGAGCSAADDRTLLFARPDRP